MVYGIGVDTASVARLQSSLASEAFCRRVFSEAERALLAGRGEGRAAETAAANFAAKEAFLKAVGTGLGGFALAEIAVLREPGGRPYYALTGKVARWCGEEDIVCHLSLTHEGGFATAFALLERKGEGVQDL